MTIERDGTQCDGCRTYEPGRYLPFKGKIRRLKELGWLITKRNEIWRHYCPECRSKYKKNTTKPKPQPQGEYWWQKY